jgi:hypothetical protein
MTDRNRYCYDLQIPDDVMEDYRMKAVGRIATELQVL